MLTAYTHIVEDSANQLFAVRDAGSTELAHAFRALPVKRVRGAYEPKKGAREILVRKVGCRLVAQLAAPKAA